jgi:uncharacterized membrane protein YphA (DoxX/SURF4 family)
MENLIKGGRILFAIPTLVFGIQYIGLGKYQGGLPPVPPWAPGGAVGAYLIGVVLVAAGVSIISGKYAQFSALLMGVLFLLCVLFLHLPRLSAVLHNGNDRTRALEPLALGGAAFALSAIQPMGGLGTVDLSANNKLILLGRLLFGISMIVFGIQHFMYASFLATLVMAWLPAHLFWIYLTGTAMVAAGLAITAAIQARLAGILLGVMFLLWVLLLHGPRVFPAIHNQDELTSLFVALAFSGSSFIFAAALSGYRLAPGVTD